MVLIFFGIRLSIMCCYIQTGGYVMTGSDLITAVTFSISPDLKACVENLSRNTNRSPSYFYNQLVVDHIDELGDIYDCLAIIENVKKVRKRPYCLSPLWRIMVCE